MFPEFFSCFLGRDLVKYTAYVLMEDYVECGIPQGADMLQLTCRSGKGDSYNG